MTGQLAALASALAIGLGVVTQQLPPPSPGPTPGESPSLAPGLNVPPLAPAPSTPPAFGAPGQAPSPAAGPAQPPLAGPTAEPSSLPTPGMGPPPLPPGPPLPPLAGVPPFGMGRPTQSDVPYGTDPRHRLDLFYTEGISAAPMVLLLHGGAWMMGDKLTLGVVGEYLARQGLVVAVANYRLSPAVQHPVHAQDVARALAWFYQNGRSYGGDPERLYLAGHSSGAHLAALVALDPTYLAAEGLTPSVVRGVVGLAGAVYDLDARYAATPLAPMLFPVFGPDPERWALAAPTRYVHPAAPPFLLVHGLNDMAAPAVNTQAMAGALQREGVRTQLELLPGQDHVTVVLVALPALRAFVQ